MIKCAFPDTPKDERFLRPAMIEALLEHEPVSRSEFAENIPFYLRNATNSKEAKAFLDQDLELIAGAELSDEI